MQKVIEKELPVNHAILGNLQDVFNLLPNLSNPTASTSAEIRAIDGEGRDAELTRAMSVKTNDQLMSIYLSSLIRAITAFHDLIENKIQNKQQQLEGDGRKEGDEKEKDKNKDEGERDEDGKSGNGIAEGGEKESSKKKSKDTGKKG